MCSFASICVSKSSLISALHILVFIIRTQHLQQSYHISDNTEKCVTHFIVFTVHFQSLSSLQHVKMSSCTEWVNFNQKNKPQGNALAAGIFILFTCGIQIGWIYHTNIPNMPWAHNHSNLVIMLTYSAFYVMAIAGAYLAALVSERLTKKNIYVSADFKLISISILKTHHG